MLKLSAKIVIESAKRWTLTKVTSVDIERNVDKLTSTCKISIPKNVKFKDEVAIPIKRGDKITVELGYNDELTTAFIGYVSKVNVQTPIVIECEDIMFLLKQKNCKAKTYVNPDIKKVLEEQVGSGVKIEIIGKVSLGGKLVVQAITAAELLNYLREKVGVKSYFSYDNKIAVLNVGYVFTQNSKGKLFKYNSHKNIVSYSELKQNSEEDKKIKVVANGTTTNGKKIKVEVGDSDGEKRTLTKINITKEALKSEAENLLKKLKVDGLTGSFEIFGGKLVGLMDAVELTLDDVNKGTFQVGKNVISYGSGGYRQKLTIIE